MSLIKLDKICAGYSPNKYALQDVNFEVHPNDFIGIIGPNGGGKSTLLKVILGTIPFKTGEIQYSWATSKAKIQGKMGYLPQGRSYDTKFPISVREVVLSGLMGQKTLWQSYSKAEKILADELIEKLGLSDFSKASIGDLSGGQAQRAFLGRAVISKPKVLILDEPDTYVDQQFEDELYTNLNELNKDMAILLVSHDIGTISSYIKTIACVNKTLHYHNSNKVSADVLKVYDCPLELITHGKIPHRVLKNH